MPWCVSRWHAPLQACSRPSMWCFGERNLRRMVETWHMDVSPNEAFDKIVEAAKKLSQEQHELFEDAEVSKENKDELFLQIFSYTPKCQYLDVVELHLHPGQESGTRVEAISFSSGFWPAWFPCGPIWNMLCCWIPFTDGDLNKKRLEALREAITVPVTSTDNLSKC
ncbi:uncharacterized protein [Oscarella lobularis]|uniref:uncharacterized protein n=1 Tax=Oscarella lobularis TaxID=121494 RepID=UPI0033139B3B